MPNCNIKYPPPPPPTPPKKAPQNPLSLKTYRRGVEPVGGLDGLWTFQVRIEIQVPGRKIHIAVDLLSPLSLVHKPAMHSHVHIIYTSQNIAAGIKCQSQCFVVRILGMNNMEQCRYFSDILYYLLLLYLSLADLIIFKN